MADRKITDLTALAAGSQATGDLLTIVDVSESAAADKNKKITVESLFKGIPSNVGIGTSSPGVNLEIVSTSINTIAKLKSSSSTNGGQLQINGTDFIVRNRDNGNVEFWTNDSERMQIDSSGNVGVGGSAVPTFGGYNTATLHLRQASSGSNGSQLRMTTGASGHTASDGAYLSFWGGDNNVYLFNRENASISFGTNDTERMRLNSSGNLGIGTSSPAYELDVRSSDTTTVNINAGTSNLSRLFFSDITVARGFLNYDHSSDSLRIGSAGTERMRIDSSGNVLFAKTTTGLQNDGFEIGAVGGGRQLSLTQSGNGVPAMYINHRYGAGTQSAIQFYFGTSHVGSINVTSTATAYVTSSDYRLKENVVDLDGAITRVKQLQPRRFNFIVDADTTVDGFLAHEAQAVVPEAVTGTHDEVDNDNNPVYQGIDQSKLVPLLTAALQEAIAEIETLKTKVAALEAG